MSLRMAFQPGDRAGNLTIYERRNMKPTSFNYGDYLRLQAENDKLRAENISLRAERDALLKSTMKVSEKIETIQPRGLLE